jgi:hypothetical protein
MLSVDPRSAQIVMAGPGLDPGIDPAFNENTGASI